MTIVQPIRLLIVDDSLIVVEALKQLFKETINIEIIGVCFDDSEVLSFVQRNRTDVILMGIKMKIVNGFTAIKEIKKYDSKIKIIGFAIIYDTIFIHKVIAIGADGFISKYEVNKELMLREFDRVMSL